MAYQQVLEILTEEPSMELFLRGMLPRVLPKEYVLDVNCFIRPHEGKSDLKKSIPKKIRAYQHLPYLVKVIIVHDQDSNDCIELKKKLIETIPVPSSIPYMIRIACKELENWYLGDFDSLEKIYPDIKGSKATRKSKYRNPDNVFGAHELGLLSGNFSKTGAARALGSLIAIETNRSPSFQQFIRGLSRFVAPH